MIAVGNGKILENGQRGPMDVKEGDRILFGKYAGSDIKIEGEEYLILREDEVLGVLPFPPGQDCRSGKAGGQAEVKIPSE